VKLTVSYTFTETVNVDVKDYELTENQLSELAEFKAYSACPSNASNVRWEWIKDPKPFGSQRIPPNEYWLETIRGLAATNGHFLALKSFSFPENFEQNRLWIMPEKISKDKMNKLLSIDFSKLSNHPGWFKPVFKPFTEIDGLKVLGSTPDSPGYMVVDSELVGIVMPASGQEPEDFQFS
jgi:hypothetical protein